MHFFGANGCEMATDGGFMIPLGSIKNNIFRDIFMLIDDLIQNLLFLEEN